MKTKGIFWVSMMLVLSFMACSRKVANEAGKNVDANNSRNSLDWAGVYLGTLPCADCEGIQTSLCIKSDSTYILRSKYLGKGNEAFETKGKFSWDATGNIIMLKGINPSEQPTQYAVGENKLKQLDLEGKEIGHDSASNYILKKMEPENTLTEKYWKLIELNTKPVIVSEGMHEPFITFAKEENRTNGNGSCNGFFGQYQLDETSNHISFSKMASTRMACINMGVEAEFMKALDAVYYFDLDGDRLTLNDDQKTPLAVFKVEYVY